jgi:hypothetical protein
MTIQFQCPACEQPIEVDAEWASRLVACPYCHKTVTAPADSTLAPGMATPTASPLSTSPGSPATVELLQRPGATRTNPFAPWALGLSGLSLLAFVCLSMYTAAKMLDLVGPGATPEEVQKAMWEHIQSSGMTGWVSVMAVGFMAAFALWLTAVLVSILALTRYPARRKMSVAAIVICGIVPLWFCLGMAASP